VPAQAARLAVHTAGRPGGAGGFINISQNAKEVVFVGTFTAGRLKLDVRDRRIAILEEGQARKFVTEIEHRTYSGEYATKRRQAELVDAYSAMVSHLVAHYYCGVTRYTTSGFLRLKLGEALAQRGVAPHIYVSAQEAQAHLHDAE